MFRGLIEFAVRMGDTRQTIAVITNLLRLSASDLPLHNFIFTLPSPFLKSYEPGQTLTDRIVNSCSSLFGRNCSAFRDYVQRVTRHMDRVPDFDQYYGYFIQYQSDEEDRARSEAHRKRMDEIRNSSHRPWHG